MNWTIQTLSGLVLCHGCVFAPDGVFKPRHLVSLDEVVRFERKQVAGVYARSLRLSVEAVPMVWE